MNVNGKWYSEPELAAYIKDLEVRISVLEDKHHNECGQIAHYDDELKAAKRLLKLAVEDIRDAMRSYDPCEICFLLDDDGACPAEDDEDCGKKYKWRYEYEALALIGGGKDETK